MLTAEDVRVLDLNAAYHGVPTHRLMSNAGRVVAGGILRGPRPRRVLVLAGLGNNGGDGAVAARLLAKENIDVHLLYAGDPTDIRTEPARAARAMAKAAGVSIHVVGDAKRLVSESDLVVDALLGVGVEGELRGTVRDLVRIVNASGKPVLAIDVPTGLGTKMPLRASRTITLHDRKRGMSAAACGRVEVADIGIPSQAQECGPGDLSAAWRRHDPGSHKGQNGRLLVVAGGPYTGAPIISSMAALAVGVDLVRLYAPHYAAHVARVYSPDLVVHDAASSERLEPPDVAGIRRLLPKVDGVLVGPGLGSDRPTLEAIQEILAATQKSRTPTVIDADAHRAAGRDVDLLRRRSVIATPHAKEFERLTGKKLPKERPGRVAEKEAKRLGVTLLVKGPTDWVTDGRRTKANRIHHPWMTVGGTGDALAGVTAGLVCQGADPWRASCAAAFLNGEAGRKAFEERSWSTRATDLVRSIPLVLRDWLD